MSPDLSTLYETLARITLTADVPLGYQIAVNFISDRDSRGEFPGASFVKVEKHNVIKVVDKKNPYSM